MKPGRIAAIAVVISSTFMAYALAGSSADTTAIQVIKQSNEKLRRFVLDNGMICLVKEDHSAPVAAVQIWVGTGAIDEKEFLGGGLSHYVEHMIFKGTPTRPVGAITKEINDAGGEINAYTATDRTVFHVTMPSAKWKVGVDVLADAVMHASFPTNEWERERNVILREFAMDRDEPGHEISELLYSTAYRVHPYRVPVIGYEDIFKTITHDDLARFFHENYVPDNMITVVAGDVNADEVERALRAVFAPFTRRTREPVVLPTEPPQLSPRFARKTGAYQLSRLLWSYHTVALTHPDAPALDVLAVIAGEGRSSRLVQEIKERKKLVYDIDAWSSTPREPGLFGISATFDPTNETAVIDAIQNELDSWSTKPFTDDELEKAKRIVLVNEVSGLQTMDGQAYDYASGEFYASDARFSEQYLEEVSKVDAAALQSVVGKYFVKPNRTIAVLSPENTNQAAVALAAPVTSNEVQKLLLSNGIPLLVRSDHRLPFVYFTVALRGGLLTETKNDNGITSLMSDLLTRGTAKHSAEELAKIVESLGGTLAPFSGRNSFGLQGRCLSKDADQLTELMAECLLEPAFPPEEIEKQRQVQLAAIEEQHEQPFFIAEEALLQTLFPNHPYRWNPEGSIPTVKKITRDDLLAHFKRHVMKNNVVISIFGDVTPERARELAERYFTALPDHGELVEANPMPEPKLPARVKQREPKQQTILLVGFPGVDLKDPRVDALAVIGNALSGLSSDLGIEVRDKRGLVYYIGAFDRPGVEPGLFAVYAGTRAETVTNVEGFVNAELARVATKGLREEEFQRAKEQIIASEKMSLQDNAGLAQTCALDELYGLGYRHSFMIEDRLKALTLDKLREVAATMFKENRQAVSLVLPEEKDVKKENAP